MLILRCICLSIITTPTGGIGHAAISICKHFGADIYTTTSKAKRSIVHDMGIQHVFDSRSTSWYDDVMRVTGGQGVDVVLNSLAGAHQKLCFQALRPGGRMLGVGKVDIYRCSKIPLLPFKRNITFCAIDMDRMANEDHELLKQVTDEVSEMIDQGHYKVRRLAFAKFTVV